MALPLPAVADGEEEVGTSVEAWYRGNLTEADEPLCILPCPELAVPESPQAEDTLHVGVSAGRETARTYFSLDLSGLASGSTLTGGTVRLPVAGADAGTTSPELADLIACAVDSFVHPAQGGPPNEAPPVDCSRSVMLELDDDGEAFTFDLAPLTTAEPTFGDFRVAVIPSELAAEEAQTWRVAFHGRDRETDDAEPITAQIRYRIDSDFGAPQPGIGGVESDEEIDPPADGAVASPSFESGQWSAPTFDDTPAPTVQPEGGNAVIEEPLVAPDEPQQAPTQPTLAIAPATHPAYPQVWLLPLAFLALGGLLTRSLSVGYVVDDASSKT
ncbi:MAG: hypothetical protein KY469_01375 [Actinobacteria bacterium]|nr:hypothetical protein [Actinomycetota bacterium]